METTMTNVVLKGWGRNVFQPQAAIAVSPNVGCSFAKFNQTLSKNQHGLQLRKQEGGKMTQNHFLA